MGLFGKILDALSWTPKKDVIYKSWTKSPYDRGNERSFVVKIRINKTDFDGSFSVGKTWCEIRTSRYKMIVPAENVVFSKTTKSFDTTRKYGQNGGSGKITTYIAEVKHYSTEDVVRFKSFKSQRSL